jgi:hypothetical protein
MGAKVPSVAAPAGAWDAAMPTRIASVVMNAKKHVVDKLIFDSFERNVFASGVLAAIVSSLV